MKLTTEDYKENIPRFDIVNKEGQTVPFKLNEPQLRLLDEMSQKNVILKVRQLGFSSLILAVFTLDFLLIENSRAVVLSHDGESAQKLLDRVKFFINSVKDKRLKVELRYNSRAEMVNADKNSSIYIGRAGSKSFGRGDTINNLHLSEWAYYEHPERLLASILQAVTPTKSKVFIESTANGMNYYKEFWDKSKAGLSGFKPHFFDNQFYSKAFLDEKRQELGEEMFKQEYPANDLEAFISSGNPFFDREALRHYLAIVKKPTEEYRTYHDLLI
jgi:hypothetical protein